MRSYKSLYRRFILLRGFDKTSTIYRCCKTANMAAFNLIHDLDHWMNHKNAVWSKPTCFPSTNASMFRTEIPIKF